MKKIYEVSEEVKKAKDDYKKAEKELNEMSNGCVFKDLVGKERNNWWSKWETCKNMVCTKKKAFLKHLKNFLQDEKKKPVVGGWSALATLTNKLENGNEGVETVCKKELAALRTKYAGHVRDRMDKAYKEYKECLELFDLLPPGFA